MYNYFHITFQDNLSSSAIVRGDSYCWCKSSYFSVPVTDQTTGYYEKYSMF